MTAFVIESWIWYGVAISMVVARYTARILHFKSISRLQAEDWLMAFITCLYTILIVFLNIDHNVSTNLIDPSQPIDLTPLEIQQRTWASKTILLVEQCMCAVQWGTKTCLLLLYWRLTQNLTQHLVVKAAAAYVVVTYLIMEILYFAVWCRPFSDYWETPTDNVQCTTALNHLITNLVFNLTSDLLIMSIPLPLFLMTHLEIKRKVLLVFPFSLGLFTIVCAILSKNLSFTQPFNGDWVFWYCREASTAMIVTNMPYSWTLIRRVFHLSSFFGDSASDEMQGGALQELEGMSIGRSRMGSLTAMAIFQQVTQQSDDPNRRRGSLWARLERKLNSHTSEEDGIRKATNRESGGDMSGNNVSIETKATSRNSSEDISPAKPPGPVNALDKLYRLDDDDDLHIYTIANRRYDG